MKSEKFYDVFDETSAIKARELFNLRSEILTQLELWNGFHVAAWNPPKNRKEVEIFYYSLLINN